MRIALFFAACALSSIGLSQSLVQKKIFLPKAPPKEMMQAIPLGRKAQTDTLHLSLSLKPSDPYGMQFYADQVSNPRSQTYRHFLRPEEVGNRFGMPLATIDRLSTDLKQSGFQVRCVAKNRLSILVDAPVSVAEGYFDTEIVNFQAKGIVANDTGIRFSFTTSPKIPAKFAGLVTNISGLESFTRPRKLSLTAAQLRGAYQLESMFDNGKTGQGRTVGISNWDGYRMNTLTQLYQGANLPVPSGGVGSNIQTISVNGGDGYQEFQFGEGDLDIQCVLGMAPLCNLLLYDNASPQGANDPIAVLTQETDDNAADIITESYGWNLDAPTTEAAHTLHLSLTLQGITYVAASGDTGTDWQGFNYPQIDPEVLTIGGTTLRVDATRHRVIEVGWNSNGYSGGGGWVASNDSINVRPSYQATTHFLSGAGVPDVQSVPYRLVPDLSMNADPNTGYVVYTPSGPQVTGGTSGASPTFAGGLCVSVQQLLADGFLGVDQNGKSRFGRIQDLLYGYGGDSLVYYDVTMGDNGVLPNGSPSIAGPGWDTDTGWGAFNFSGFVARLEGTSVIASFKLSSSSAYGGEMVTGTITLSNPAPTGGVQLKVQSSESYVQLPGSVMVPAGATTATFNIQTVGVANIQIANIMVSNTLSSMGTTITIYPAVVSSVTVTPSPVVSGNSSTGFIKILGVAPPNGMAVILNVTKGALTVPNLVKVPTGANSASFTCTAKQVTSSSQVTVSASFANTTVQSVVNIVPLSVAQITLSQASVVGGSNTTVLGLVTLNGQTPSGGIVVKLKSSNPKIASCPAQITIGAGKNSGPFTLTHLIATSASSAIVSATTGMVSVQTELTIHPFAVTSIVLSSASVSGGTGLSGIVTLNAQVGSGGKGLSVKLAEDSIAVTGPSSIPIQMGSSSGSFQLKSNPVLSDTPVQITAGIGNSSAKATVTVLAPVLVSLTLSPTTVKGSSSTQVLGTLTLSSNAPKGGIPVSVTISDPQTSSNMTVTIPFGKSTAAFRVPHVKVSSTIQVQVTAILGGSTSSAVLTVTP